MSRRRLVTAVVVFLGALFMLQLFRRPVPTFAEQFLFDLFVSVLAVVVLARVRPARTLDGEIGRLLIGALLLPLSLVFLRAGILGIRVIAPEGELLRWEMIGRVLPAFALAWSFWAVVRIGGEWWLRRSRRVVIGAALALVALLLRSETFLEWVAVAYAILFVIPTGRLEELDGRRRWWVLALLLAGPLMALFCSLRVTNSGVGVTLGGGIRMELGPQVIDSLRTRGVSDFAQRLLAFYWLSMPVRMLIATAQGKYGLRIPIWLKLAFTYLFSTLIPGLLLVALVAVGMYAGVGTLRARAVRNLVYQDLENLEEALRERRLDAFSPADSVAQGMYLRLPPASRERESGGAAQPFPVFPGVTPGAMDQMGGRTGMPMATLPEGWEMQPPAGGGAARAEPQEVWVRMAAKRAPWALPDTLPKFPGWSDTTMGQHGILPVGEGRSAYAAAVVRSPGSRLVYVALRPMNRELVEGYKRVVGADIVINPSFSLSAEGSDTGNVQLPLGAFEERDPRWRTMEAVATERDTTGDFWHRPLGHGICELQSWPRENQPGEQSIGMISVWTSIAGLFSSLYTTTGLSKLTVIALLVIGILLLLVVLLSSVLGFGITRTITSSVASLRQGTEQLRKGNLDTTIRVSNRDELGELADSFNRMTADLRRMLEETAEKERLEHEVQIARQIQLRLLPERLPEPRGFRFAARSDPALEVGGDYYDAFTLGNGDIQLAVGDVSGKGVAAAMLMSNLQASLHALAGQSLDLREMVRQLNRQICDNSTPEMFITFFTGILDSPRRKLTFVNAGHDEPILLRADGEVESLTTGGIILGVIPETEYETGEVTLAPGDLLVCYSDGLTEAMDEEGEEFGRERLLESIRQLHGEEVEIIVEEILTEVRLYAGDERAAMDDLTLMVIAAEEGGTFGEEDGDGG